MCRHPKFPKHVRPTDPVCLQDWKSQRLHGLFREFLTSRSLRREHWPGGTEAARFLEPTRSILTKRNGAILWAAQFTKPEGRIRSRLRTAGWDLPAVGVSVAGLILIN
jgi:hypothetical protein